MLADKAFSFRVMVVSISILYVQAHACEPLHIVNKYIGTRNLTPLFIDRSVEDFPLSF